MTTERNLICIGCPMGCRLTVVTETVSGEDKEVSCKVLSVSGNTCPRGDSYARKEVTAPTRIVTSSLPVSGGTLAMVSCKTSTDVPKASIFCVTEAMKGLMIQAPVEIGQVLVRNIAGTGADLIATRAIPEKSI